MHTINVHRSSAEQSARSAFTPLHVQQQGASPCLHASIASRLQPAQQVVLQPAPTLSTVDLTEKKRFVSIVHQDPSFGGGVQRNVSSARVGHIALSVDAVPPQSDAMLDG